MDHSKELKNSEGYCRGLIFSWTSSKVMVFQRGSGSTLWRTPLEPFWRPMVTWRRVLRTIFIMHENLPVGHAPDPWRGMSPDFGEIFLDTWTWFLEDATQFELSDFEHAAFEDPLKTRGKPSTIVSAGRARRTGRNHACTKNNFFVVMINLPLWKSTRCEMSPCPDNNILVCFNLNEATHVETQAQTQTR